jgi:hypothetical protein
MGEVVVLILAMRRPLLLVPIMIVVFLTHTDTVWAISSVTLYRSPSKVAVDVSILLLRYPICRVKSMNSRQGGQSNKRL